MAEIGNRKKRRAFLCEFPGLGTESQRFFPKFKNTGRIRHARSSCMHRIKGLVKSSEENNQTDRGTDASGHAADAGIGRGLCGGARRQAEPAPICQQNEPQPWQIRQWLVGGGAGGQHLRLVSRAHDGRQNRLYGGQLSHLCAERKHRHGGLCQRRLCQPAPRPVAGLRGGDACDQRNDHQYSGCFLRVELCQRDGERRDVHRLHA